MSKIHTTLTIDQEIFNKVKNLRINMSGEFQNFLTKFVNNYNQNIDGITLDILNIEIEKLKKESDIIYLELQNKLKMREKIEENIKINEENRLKIEKEKLESMKKCINCGNIFGDKSNKYSFKAGFVCRSCFLGATSQSIERWNNVPTN